MSTKMIKLLVIIMIVQFKVTSLKEINNDTVFKTHVKCVEKLHVEPTIAVALMNLDTTLPENVQEMNELVECDLRRLGVIYENNTMIAKKFKKLFYVLLDFDYHRHHTKGNLQVIEDSFKYCGIRKGISLDGEIGVKLYNCIIKRLRDYANKK